MPERIDLAERLFNLTCALLYTKRGLTKQEIFSTVQGYKERFVHGGDNSSLDRMFERDKQSLTESGVLWRTRDSSEASEDNIDFRYLIADEEYRWPDNFRPTAKQVALLNLAAKAWANASMAADANRGIIRIRAMGESSSDSDLIGIAPRIRTHENSFLPLSEAIEQRTRVRFSYRKAGSETENERAVEPWSLQNISGQWLLLAFDTERNEQRNFLLRRIVSSVVRGTEPFELPDKSQLEGAIRSLKQHTSEQKAILRVPRDSAAWFHFNLGQDQSEPQVITIDYMDIYLLAEELMDFATEIEIIEPLELKSLIRNQFEKVLLDHE